MDEWVAMVDLGEHKDDRVPVTKEDRLDCVKLEEPKGANPDAIIIASKEWLTGLLEQKGRKNDHRQNKIRKQRKLASKLSTDPDECTIQAKMCMMFAWLSQIFWNIPSIGGFTMVEFASIQVHLYSANDWNHNRNLVNLAWTTL